MSGHLPRFKISDWKEQVDHLKDRQIANSGFLSDLVQQKESLNASEERMAQRLMKVTRAIEKADDEIEVLTREVQMLERVMNG